MSRNRVEELDVVRGLALCGIHVVNIYQQVVLRELYPEGIGHGLGELPGLVRYGFYERFLPLFTLLFGISFGIFLVRAGRRTDRPRLVLARRLGVLAVVGALHQLVHPGEVLLVYAAMGLLVLLPASYLGGVAASVTGIVLVLAGGQFVPGYGVMPGLLVLGFGLAVLGVPEGLARHPGRVAVAFVCSAVPALGYVSAVNGGVTVPPLSWGWVSLTGQLAAVLTAVAYATATVLFLRTPVARPVHAVLAPMGRMALTNYLMATALILSCAPLLGIDDLDDTAAITGLTIGVVIVQAVWSAWWLRRFRYGPVEWVWRCATWWQWVPLRRGAAPAPHSGDGAASGSAAPSHRGE